MISGLAMGIVFGILSMLSFGITDFILGAASKHAGPFKSTIWPTIIQLMLCLLLVPLFFTIHNLSTYTVALLIFAGFTSTVGALYLSKGMKVGNVSVIILVASAWGAATAVLGYLFLDEPITYLQIFYIILIVAGTLLVSLDMDNLFNAKAVRKLHLGIEFAVVSLLGWSLFFLSTGFLVQQIGWFSAGFLVNIPKVFFLLVFGLFTKESFKMNREQLPIMLSMGLLSLIGFLTYNVGISYNYTDIVAPISASSALVTIMLAVLLMKEKLANYQKLGAVLIMAGIIALAL